MDDITDIDAVSRTDAEHSVIANYRLSGTGFGEQSERVAVLDAQSILRKAVEQAGVGEFDGNEFGGGEAALYTYGPDADALFAVMEPALRVLPFRPTHVVLRYGPEDDPFADEIRVEF